MGLVARKFISKSVHLPRFSFMHTNASCCSAKIRRINSLGVQMISKPLHKQIFGDKKPRCSSKALARSKEHLLEQGLWGQDKSVQPDIDVELPPLQGDNIDQHFRAIASHLSEPYLQLALDISHAAVPPMPDEWSFTSGWSRYDSDGSVVPVETPSDRALVFDVEVCVRESPQPVLAVAVGMDSWYSWVSERLACGERFFAPSVSSTAAELIPMGGEEGHERLVVGHNVSYDRARIREQYNIEVKLHTHMIDILTNVNG